MDKLLTEEASAGGLPYVARDEAADSLASLVRRSAPRRTLAAFLDALEADDRIAAVRGLGRRELGRLYELAANDDPEPASPELLVPAATPAGHTVEWVGLNSLPLFRRFTKRFARAAGPEELAGYNTGAAQALVGPGYFTVVVRPGHPTELLMDYTRLPSQAPRGWPGLRPNEAGLSRWVFAGMHDYFRPLGAHAGVGAAFGSDGRSRGQFFALARGPTLALGG